MNARPDYFCFDKLGNLGPDGLTYDPYRDAGDKYYYDNAKAEKKVQFFKKELCLTKGEWIGKPFEPFPWAEQVIRCIFGWYEVGTNLRRYQTAFIYVPRKNAKSELVAGIADCVFFTDKEPDNELYIAAKTSKQAETLYNMAKKMAILNPGLDEDVYLKETTKTMYALFDDSKMCVVSADGDTAHSLSPGFVAIDELHVHKNKVLIEALTTGMGARSQPLKFFITTAGLDVPGTPVNEELDYALKVLRGDIFDPRYMPVIFAASPEEDWKSPEVWAKYNPSYPVVPSKAYLEAALVKARHIKSEEISFKRLYLNMMVSSEDNWLDMDIWRLGSEDFEESAETGNVCFAGIDLAYRQDLGGYVLYFPESGRTICRFYVPQIAVDNDKARRYAEWVDSGHLRVAGTTRLKYSQIKKDLLADAEEFKIMEIAIDPWNGAQFAGELDDEVNPATFEEFEVKEFRQGTRSLNEPSKEFESLVAAGFIKHNSPVLDWMAANVLVHIDENNNIRPVKSKTALKVDGIIMLIMSVGLSMVWDGETDVYEDEGMVDLSAYLDDDD